MDLAHSDGFLNNRFALSVQDGCDCGTDLQLFLRDLMNCLRRLSLRTLFRSPLRKRLLRIVLHNYLKASPMPLAPLLWLVLALNVFFSSFFTEICDGSLVSGCSFDVTGFPIHGYFEGMEAGLKLNGFS